MPRRSRYLLIWPLANLRHRPWISAVSVIGVAGAAFVVATLLGFLSGYQSAVRRDVDRLGYDLLITAKGCPYEAATLMLRGGVGLRYMPDGVVQRLRAESAVVGTWPTLIHPVREPSNPGGMALFKGVEASLAEALGLRMREGAWFPGDGVVLGYEAAELEQRHAGDRYLIPAAGSRPSTEMTVLGVLERTGTQLDGTILLPLARVQELFALPGKLTGVGVKVDASVPGALDSLRDRYNLEPDLQVVTLSQVEQALRKATEALRAVVEVLAWVLALMAAAILLNTSLLRTLGEHQQFAVLHAIGLSRGFIVVTAMAENLLLVLAGAAAGLLAATLLGGWSSDQLVGWLPYAPDGDLVVIAPAVAAAIIGGAAVIGVLASVPPLWRLRGISADLTALRGG